KNYSELARRIGIASLWRFAAYPDVVSLNRRIEKLRRSARPVNWTFWSYIGELAEADPIENARHVAKGEMVLTRQGFYHVHDWVGHAMACLIMGPVCTEAFKGMFSFLVSVMDDPVLGS